jgi:hypothetical protein
MDIKKTLQFSVLLWGSSFVFVFIYKILGVHLKVYDLIYFQQLFLPLWFFAMFDGGFEDISTLKFKNRILNKKFVKIFVINLMFILLVFILCNI